MTAADHLGTGRSYVKGTTDGARRAEQRTDDHRHLRTAGVYFAAVPGNSATPGLDSQGVTQKG
jgi:hypothetical protein